MRTTRRIGPQMRRAVAYVAANPGCSKIDVARYILDRAIKAGLIVAWQGRGNAYSLRVPPDVADTP